MPGPGTGPRPGWLRNTALDYMLLLQQRWSTDFLSIKVGFYMLVFKILRIFGRERRSTTKRWK